MENRFIRILDGALNALAVAAMGSMTIGIIVSVISRYFFSLTAAWSEELIGLLFVASSFVGCVIAVKRNEHIGIDLLHERLGELGRRRLRMISALVTILVQIVVFDASLGWIAVSGNVPSPGLEIPFTFFYALLPASCVLIAFYAAIRLFDDMKSALRRKEAGS